MNEAAVYRRAPMRGEGRTDRPALAIGTATPAPMAGTLRSGAGAGTIPRPPVMSRPSKVSLTILHTGAPWRGVCGGGSYLDGPQVLRVDQLVWRPENQVCPCW